MTSKDRQPLVTFITMIMMAILLLSCIAGCSTTVPVTVEFPKPPDRGGNAAMKACPQLKELEPDPRLTDVAKTINLNYGTYYECAVKVDTWIEWYHSQKKIFESAGK